MIDYNKLIDDGYSTEQIEQIKQIDTFFNNIPGHPIDVTEHISTNIDTDTFKKIVDATKNNKIKSWFNCNLILHIASKNKDFDILLNNDLQGEKAHTCYISIMELGPEKTQQILDAINSNSAFSDVSVLKAIKHDVIAGIDVLEYLKPEYSIQQLMTRREANTDIYDDLIKMMNPDNCAYEMISQGVNLKLPNNDITELSYEVVYKKEFNNNFYLAMKAKRNGYNFGDLFKEDLSGEQRNFLSAFIDKNISKNKIMQYLDKYNNDQDKLEKMGRIVPNLSNSDLKKFIKSIDQNLYEDYEFDTMSLSASHDKALLSILVNNTKADSEIYEVLSNLMLRSEMQSNLSLGRLFYDNILPDISKYHSFAKLSNEQTLVLAKAYDNNEINNEQLDLLRIRQIEPDVLYYLCKMADKGIDINQYQMNATKMTAEDAKQLYNSFDNLNKTDNHTSHDFLDEER